MSHALSYLFTALVLLIAVGGCRKSTLTSSGGIPDKPGIGSSYTYLAYSSYDSTGQPLPLSTAPGVTIVTSMVVETGKWYNGVGNVVSMRSDGDGSYGDELLFDYRSNGDLAIIRESGDTIRKGWRAFPVGSRGTIIQTTDSTWEISRPGGDTTSRIITSEASYVGSETLKVGDESILTHKIDNLITDRQWRSGSPVRVRRSRVIYWIAPSIGTWVRSVHIPVEKTDPAIYYHMSLIDYQLE
jgi:hypothetical protein